MSLAFTLAYHVTSELKLLIIGLPKKKNDLIPARFTRNFILESVKFILKNNNFLFDNVMYKQVSGSAMGTKFAPPYACLTIGYLEETRLFPKILKNYFTDSICMYIKDNFFRYMDDGFIALAQNIDAIALKNALNDLHPSIKFTMETGKMKSNTTESLNFLDIEVILNNGKFVTTDIYYKETNPHDYLNFHSAHPKHIKDTIPFNLAKRIIVFVTDEDTTKKRLNELKQWLINCDYPLRLINKAFEKARLQGPAPKQSKDIIPLVTTYYPSRSYDNPMKTISNLLKSIQDPDTKTKFKDTKPILALRQPPNLTSILTNAKFTSESISQTRNRMPGIFLCDKTRCKLRKLYLQPVDHFTTANGTEWQIRSHVTCKSTNVVYFLTCNMCNGAMNYIGQTTNFQKRLNNHISESRTGLSCCNFPKHVYECGKKNNKLKEPFSKAYAFFALTLLL